MCAYYQEIQTTWNSVNEEVHYAFLSLETQLNFSYSSRIFIHTVKCMVTNILSPKGNYDTYAFTKLSKNRPFPSKWLRSTCAVSIPPQHCASSQDLCCVPLCKCHLLLKQVPVMNLYKISNISKVSKSYSTEIIY